MIRLHLDNNDLLMTWTKYYCHDIAHPHSTFYISSNPYESVIFGSSPTIFHNHNITWPFLSRQMFHIWYIQVCLGHIPRYSVLSDNGSHCLKVVVLLYILSRPGCNAHDLKHHFPYLYSTSGSFFNKIWTVGGDTVSGVQTSSQQTHALHLSNVQPYQLHVELLWQPH